MKATGIVRRIDELGRLVIPKEIRRSMRIRESDPIEIYTDRDGEIILRKYARMRELGDYAPPLVQALNGVFGVHAVITDTEQILTASGARKKQLIGAALSEPYTAALLAKRGISYDDMHTPLLSEQNFPIADLTAIPITANGDPVGSVALFYDERRERFSDSAQQALKTVSLYLGKLLEE